MTAMPASASSTSSRTGSPRREAQAFRATTDPHNSDATALKPVSGRSRSSLQALLFEGSQVGVKDATSETR